MDFKWEPKTTPWTFPKTHNQGDQTMTKLVYLSGPIAGMTHNEANGWREEVAFSLDPGIHTLSPMRGKEILIDQGRITHEMLTTMRSEHPDVLNLDHQSITTRDRFDTRRCDAMILNMLPATVDKPTVGSWIELGWADAWRVPVVLICKRDDDMTWCWKHPIVRGTVGWHVEDIKAAVDIINGLFKEGS